MYDSVYYVSSIALSIAVSGEQVDRNLCCCGNYMLPKGDRKHLQQEVGRRRQFQVEVQWASSLVWAFCIPSLSSSHYSGAFAVLLRAGSVHAIRQLTDTMPLQLFMDNSSTSRNASLIASPLR
jgi:hypothetical protein